MLTFNKCAETCENGARDCCIVKEDEHECKQLSRHQKILDLSRDLKIQIAVTILIKNLLNIFKDVTIYRNSFRKKAKNLLQKFLQESD